MTSNQIWNQLSDLDEATLSCDPSTPEGQAELEQIRARMEELEADLSEIRHLEFLETFGG